MIPEGAVSDADTRGPAVPAEMTADRRMRASDQDRENAVELLREAYAAGRLTREELDERSDAAYSARTWGELADLTFDLPVAAGSGSLRSGTVTGRLPRAADQRLFRQPSWTFAFMLAAILASLLNTTATWAAAVILPLALLLPFALRSAGASRRRSRRASSARPGGRRPG